MEMLYECKVTLYCFKQANCKKLTHIFHDKIIWYLMLKQKFTFF